jgi:rubredoxin
MWKGLLHFLALVCFTCVLMQPKATCAFQCNSVFQRAQHLPFYCAAQEPTTTTESNRDDALRAQEIFVVKTTGNHECQACGYVYKESRGLPEKGIAPGTQFISIDKFRCPQCGASKKYFVAEEETLSGFKENMKFGLGANSLTGDQKGLLIFGGLFAGFLLFMSGYLLN